MVKSNACLADRTRQWLAGVFVAIAGALLLLARPVHASAQALPPLKTVETVRRLAADDAAKKLPVRLKAVVVFFDADWRLLFVQDHALGIYVESASGLMEAIGGRLEAGCVVEIEGYSGAGMFAPIVFSQNVRIVGKAPLPGARPVAVDQLHGGTEDSQWVTVAGVVRRSKILDKHLELELATGGRSMLVYIPEVDDAKYAARLVDAAVTVSGVCATEFKDRKWVGSRLLVPSLGQLFVRRPGTADPFSLPARSLATLGQFSPSVEPGHRVKIAGVVSWNDPSGMLYVQDEATGVRVDGDPAALRAQVGDHVEAVGFPVLGRFPRLVHGEVRATAIQSTVREPLAVSGTQTFDANIQGRLVAIEGRLLDWKHRQGKTILELETAGVQVDGHLLFHATLPGQAECPPPGSRLRITGVAELSFVDDQPTTLEVRLRSSDDMLVRAHPPWWTLAKAMSLVAALACGGLLGLVWIMALRRQVRRQTQVIRDHSRRLHALAGQLIASQEAERSSLARELHDEFAQVLATIHIHLASIKSLVTPDARARLDECLAILHPAIEQLRTLALDLRPTMLDVLGLEQALHWLVRRHQQSGFGAACLLGHLAEAKLTPDLAITCFRIVQEALTNAAKHARAREVRVELHQDTTELRLTIHDDGIGFDPSIALANVIENKSFGLLGIQERVQIVGGRVDFASGPGRGTTIAVQIPLPVQQA